MGRLEQIRDELRGNLTMDVNEIYLDFKNAADKKAQVTIFSDCNPKLSREEVLDVLEDLGFRVGNMRKKPMDTAAKEKWHREHPNNGSKKRGPETIVKPVANITVKVPEENEMREMIKQEVAAKPFVITQEMLDVVNELMAKKLEVAELLDRIDALSKQAASFGIIVEVPL